MELYFKFKIVFDYLIPIFLIGTTTIYVIIEHFKKH